MNMEFHLIININTKNVELKQSIFNTINSKKKFNPKHGSIGENFSHDLSLFHMLYLLLNQLEGNFLFWIHQSHRRSLLFVTEEKDFCKECCDCDDRNANYHWNGLLKHCKQSPNKLRIDKMRLHPKCSTNI